MAALRSGMAMLGRRSCGCSGSAASMGGNGREIHQVFRPAAVRNFESWRRFSTAVGEPKDKNESDFPRTHGQWAKYRAKNVHPAYKSTALFAYRVVVMGAPAREKKKEVSN